MSKLIIYEVKEMGLFRDNQIYVDQGYGAMGLNIQGFSLICANQRSKGMKVQILCPHNYRAPDDLEQYEIKEAK